MRARLSFARVLALLFGGAAAGCNGFDLAFVSIVEPAPFVGTTLVPTPLPFHSVANFGCPRLPPFQATFTIAIDQHTKGDLFLDTADFSFTDRTGLASAVIFSRSELAGLFGQTRVAAGARRSFDFHTRFGCGLIGLPREVVVVLNLSDGRGGRHRSRASAQLH
jgi:hypothetical protein